LKIVRFPRACGWMCVCRERWPAADSRAAVRCRRRRSEIPALPPLRRLRCRSRWSAGCATGSVSALPAHSPHGCHPIGRCAAGTPFLLPQRARLRSASVAALASAGRTPADGFFHRSARPQKYLPRRLRPRLPRISLPDRRGRSFQ
jgi:hypothetical protein